MPSLIASGSNDEPSLTRVSGISEKYLRKQKKKFIKKISFTNNLFIYVFFTFYIKEKENEKKKYEIHTMENFALIFFFSSNFLIFFKCLNRLLKFCSALVHTAYSSK